MSSNNRENETREYKRSKSELKEAVIAIGAMLNKHQRGEVTFGIRNDGTVVGQTVEESTIRDISQKISSHIEPKVFPEIMEIELEGKTCIKVTFQGSNIPYYAYGRGYIRVGDENKQLSAQQIEDIILQKNRERLRWDNQVCDGATVKDISSEKVRYFTKNAGLSHSSVKNTMAKLGLYNEGRLRNAAVILFAKKPEKFFPNCKLRCAFFGTLDASNIVDRHEYYGDIFYLIEKAEEYFLENTHIGMKVEGLYRKDIPEIDREAFREAIINAFCHRDYNEYDSVNIAIFKDRVEIRSPGGLFGGLTIEQIKTEMVSRRRNELIADMFHRVHFVERWGRGISLILTKEPTASFKEVAGVFITTFKRKTYRKETMHELDGTKQKILGLIEDNPNITQKELSSELGMNRSALQKHMNKLKELGLLKRVGSDRSGHWEVSEK